MAEVTARLPSRGGLHAWSLGAAATWMSRPLTEKVAATIDCLELEIAFLTRSWAHRHALLAVLDHLQPRPDELIQIRKHYIQLDPTAFVSACGLQPFPGMGAIFTKLGADNAETSGIYRALFEIMAEDGVGARVVRHRKNLSFAFIERLRHLPDWTRSVNWPRIEQRRIWGVKQKALLAAFLDREGYATRAEIIDALPSLHHLGYRDRASALWARTGFPIAPWAGTDRLQPVRSMEELGAAAKDFQNCVLNQYLEDTGAPSAFYIWSGTEPAMVELRRKSGSLWICNSIFGPKNADVSRETAIEIFNELPTPDDWRHITLGQYHHRERFGV